MPVRALRMKGNMARNRRDEFLELQNGHVQTPILQIPTIMQSQLSNVVLAALYAHHVIQTNRREIIALNLDRQHKT
jgi:hypothetical protein